MKVNAVGFLTVSEHQTFSFLRYSAALSPRQLTWNNFKKVSTRLILIGRQLIDLTAMKRNTTLQEKTEKGTEKTGTDRQK